MFNKKEPNPYSSHWGEYIANFESNNGEVSAILFKTNIGTKAYVHFAQGKDFNNLKDRFFGDIFDYLRENNYPKLGYIRILSDQESEEFRIEGGCRMENLELQKLHEILRRLKNKIGVILLLKPIEPKDHEQDEFYIKKVNTTLTLKKRSNDQLIPIPLLEIRSIVDESPKPTLYLEGKLVWNPKTELWEYIPH